MKKLIFLFSLIIFLVGCVSSSFTYRYPCINCDNDLIKWREDCLPTCLYMEQNPTEYNLNIPNDWELAGVRKEQFILKNVGKDKTETSINCLCIFQKLTPTQHQQVVALFGK